MTPTGNYHYKVMSFGLKNAGSTYQRMMTRMFELQLGKSIKIYVDDMVVKSKVVSKHLGDLGSTFNVLRKHKLRLNAKDVQKLIGIITVLNRFISRSADRCRSFYLLINKWK